MAIRIEVPEADRTPAQAQAQATFAFLFTDIESSTQLWEERPQAMAMALRSHDDLVRTAVRDHNGQIFSTGGDGFGVVFPAVEDALEAALHIQRSLHDNQAGVDIAIRVRMGIHAGPAEERGDDYFGPVLNRSARIMAAAHGGQILVSGLVAERLLAASMPGVEVLDLGAHRLKNLFTPEHIFQVGTADLPAEFPPLRSRRAGNIPRTYLPAMGREDELEETVQALSTNRLVTVVTDVGRSATAICFGAARSLEERFPHGAWYLDLAGIADQTELAPALAYVLGVVLDDAERPTAGSEPTETIHLAEIATALDAHPALLVLDGGTVGGELVAAVAQLLDELPTSTILVTSPAPLGLAGERVVVVRERSLPPDLQHFREVPIVGREDELARLRAEVSRAAGGDRRLIVVSGEEGIGKTRLLGELAVEVVTADGLVLRGSWDEEGVADFQAFRVAFSRYIEADGRSGRSAQSGRLRPVLDALVPSLAVDHEGNEVDRFRVLDALDSWLAQVASAQPVLLWLDDLQWADPSSLQLIQHLVRSPRRAPLVIGLTHQTAGLNRTDDISHTLTLLHRDPGYETLELTGLSTKATTTLINRIGRTKLAPRSQMLLHQWSGGNPFFLEELIRLIDESVVSDGTTRQHSVAELGQIGAPETISDVVHWRLARRSAALGQVLTVASVIGTTFDAPTLAAVLEDDLDDVEDLVDEALQHEFVNEVPGGDALLTFANDLVRQVLYQALPPRQRTRLHRRVLDVLLEAGELDPAVAARHLSVAAGPDDLDRTVDFATRAARLATENMAFENAARHYDQALHVLDRYPEEAGPRIEMLIAAGEAHNKAGALSTGQAHLQRAAIEAERRNRPDLLAQAALAWGGVLPGSPPPDQEAVDLLRSVVQRFPGDSPERALALVRQAERLHRSTTYDTRRALVDEAIAIAERLDDPRVLGWVLNSATLAMLGPDDVASIPDVAERVLLLSRQADDDELAFQGWKLLLQGLFASGRMDETRDVAASVRRLGETLRQPEYLRIAIMWDATVANLEGRWKEAGQLVNDALTVTLTGDHSQTAEIQLMLQVPRFGLKGTSPALRDMLDGSGLEDVRSFRAWFHAEAGQVEMATDLLSPPPLIDDIAEKRWYMFWADVVGFGTVASLTGDRAWARQLRDLIAPYRDTSAVLGLAAFLGSAAHHLGVMNGVLGEWDAAVADLETGLERHEAFGARPWAALSQIELAGVLTARDRPGDAGRAVELTSAAETVGQELGLSSVRQRVSRLQAATADRSGSD